MELSPEVIGILPIAFVIVAFVLHRFYSKWRERRVRNTAFTREKLGYLRSALPFLDALSPEDTRKLQEKINLFLENKRFYGCAGLEVSEEMRFVIAAEACLLILHHDGPIYPGLASILVYPSAFIARHEHLSEDGTVSHAPRELLGESWDSGKVILAWDAVSKGVANFEDGQNVALHEFAHQLDGLTGQTDGAPPLAAHSYRSWSRVLSANFEDLRARSDSGLPTVMDAYGATNPAEFFAVATETFFEKPFDLYRRRPELYEELKAYYRVDPRDWSAEQVSSR